jgi:hypothetical protein
MLRTRSRGLRGSLTAVEGYGLELGLTGGGILRSGHFEMPTTPFRAGTAGLAAAALGLAVPALGLPSSPALARAPRAVGARCPSGAAAARIHAVLRRARYRYSQERVGLAVHVAFRRIEHDGTLVRALRAGDLVTARVRADQLLVGHVVRIRIRRGSRLLLDANPTSFAVGGSVHSLRLHGRTLGQMEVSIQDVIGFIRLVHKYDGGDVVVRGSRGQARTSIGAVPRRLPGSGCVSIAGRRYAVSSFSERGFAGEGLTIWVLAPG